MSETQIIKYAIGVGIVLLCLAAYAGIDFFVKAKEGRSRSITVHVAQVAVLWMLVLVLKEYVMMAVADYQITWVSDRVVQFLATAAITAIIVRQLFMLIDRLERKQLGHGADPTSSRVVARVMKLTIVFFMILFFGERLGVSFSGLLAFGGIGGIAIGMASKDILSNVFSGIMLYFDRPFSIGDWISSPDRNIEGTVEEVGWRITRITTFDNRPLYVPNSLFSSISVENPGRMTNRRISTEIGLRYEDADKVGAVVDDIRAMLKANGKVDTTQDLLVYFNQFADSSLNIMVYCFTKTTVWAEWLAAQQEIYLAIVDIVHRHGADFAFPSQTLYMEKDGA